MPAVADTRQEEPAGRGHARVLEAGVGERRLELGRLVVDLDDRELAAVVEAADGARRRPGVGWSAALDCGSGSESMNANVPPGLSQRRTIARNSASRARGTWLSQKPVNTASTCRSGSAHASRTWRCARRRCATRRSRARSSGRGGPVVERQLALRGEERRPPAGPGRELDDLAADRERVEPAPGGIELGVPGGVVDRARARSGRGAGTSRRTRAPGPRSRRAWSASTSGSAVGGGRVAGAASAAGRRDGSARPRPALGQRLAQPEPQEAVVAGLADAVRAELRPALEVVRAAAACARPRTTGNRRSRERAPARVALRPDRRPRPERRDVDERVGVEDLGQQLDAVDDPRAGPAEVGRSVEREDAARGGRRPGPRSPAAAASAPRRRPSRPGGSRTASAAASRGRPRRPRPTSSGRDGSPSAPSSSQPPARRICSGTQWPDANGGSSHSSPTTRGDRPPASRRAWTFSSTAPEPLAEALDEVDRGVLRLGHRADRRDRVEDPLDRGRLERDDRDVGVDRPDRPR